MKKKLSNFEKFKNEEILKIQNAKKNNKKLKCKKSLYKSTYKGNAFNKNEEYTIFNEDDFINIIDNEDRIFNFTKKPKSPFYYIGDYFTV